MSSPSSQPQPLHPFRKDLKIYSGPADEDGTPSYSLLDPVRGQYYKITWAQAMVMRIFKPGMSIDDLVKAVNERSSLHITHEDIIQIFRDALYLDLLAVQKSSEQVQYMAERTKVNWAYWLLMYYLYIRIPLFNPDRFLGRTLHYVRPLVSKPAIWFYAIVSLLGILLVLKNFEEYRHTFNYFFNLQGIFFYALAITGVKICHELGHAYTAKFYRIHVPTMGIALLVLWPVLYTNVTDAWKLKKRSQRLAITIGGVSVEVVLAGLATFGWAVTEPGVMHSIFFLLSSSTWLTSLFINLNPAMRFDGYYVFCDLVGFDNLQLRAFAMTRWNLREWLLGLKAPPPEEDISPRMQKIMLYYSIYTWIYRILLYTAIAWFVYVEFTKALGILLFIVEVSVFIVSPFFSEFVQLTKMRSYFNVNPRSVITGLLASLLILWFVLPLPHEEYFTGITVPIDQQQVYIPQSGVVSKIFVKRGEQVSKGQPLIQLQSEQLNHLIASARKEVSILENQISILQISEEGRRYLSTKIAELEWKKEELKTLMEKHGLLLVKADTNGKIYEWNDDLRPGLSLPAGAVIGKIGELDHLQVVCYVPEEESGGIFAGQPASFKLPDPIIRFNGKVVSIQTTTTPYLRYPALASVYEGDLPVVPQLGTKPWEGQKFKLMQSYYQVFVALEPHEYPLRFGQTGTVEIEGPWRSKFLTLVNKGINLFWQQSGF